MSDNYSGDDIDRSNLWSCEEEPTAIIILDY